MRIHAKNADFLPHVRGRLCPIQKQGFPKGILPRFFYQPLSFVANIPLLHQWGKWRKNDHWDLDAFITLPRLEFG
ncbi:hypothetical protein P872_14285 [Rhodonellum psychrophilum GCM71 = DSM 17998]|uniref:Uncharacterized protein n=1 Tax=Rhodonellum psychrophilum GCM71 = DSM 17998 TaxID=1123057 RepID=U5BUE2_9BACT|nr:hypothetical protein P872_14285 [Rhodonellum psychrophilum GCM71 = DSM 17998]